MERNSSPSIDYCRFYSYWLFDVEQIEKDNRLQTAIDVVREQFGFLAIQKGTVLTEGSRNIERSKLIGGHSAGGLEGLK